MVSFGRAVFHVSSFAECSISTPLFNPPLKTKRCPGDKVGTKRQKLGGLVDLILEKLLSFQVSHKIFVISPMSAESVLDN